MRKIIKSIIYSSLALTIAITCSIYYQNSINAYDFEGKEDYWNKVCSDFNTSSENQEACNEYNTYLSNKINSFNTDASSSLEGLKDDLSNINEIADNITSLQKNIEAQITSVNSEINTLAESIKIAETEIKNTKKTIESRKDVIKNRMLKLQPEVNTNQFIQYIMGATDLVDLVQRSSSVEQFTANDKAQIELLNQEKIKLENDKAEKKRVEKTLTLKKESLNKQNEQIASLQEASKKLSEKYNSKIASMQAELERQAAAAAEAAKQQAANGTSDNTVVGNGNNGDVTAGDVAASGGGATIANAALAQIGVTQDCTSLVSNSLKAVGINFHGWPADYLSLGTRVSTPAPGDIIVYSGHVAIYIGNGQAVHGGFYGNQTVIWSVNCTNAFIAYVRVRGC